MVGKPITYEVAIDANTDAVTLGEVVNSTEDKDIISRIGRVYPTLAKAMRILQQAGGVKAYATLELAIADAANMKANTIVYVTNDIAGSNGLYLWDGSRLKKSAYDPLIQAKEYVDTKLTVVQKDGYLFVVQDSNGAQLLAITSSGDLQFQNSHINNIVRRLNNLQDIVGMSVDPKYLFAIRDQNNANILAITNTGQLEVQSISPNSLGLRRETLEVLNNIRSDDRKHILWALEDSNGIPLISVNDSGQVLIPSLQVNNLNAYDLDAVRSNIIAYGGTSKTEIFQGTDLTLPQMNYMRINLIGATSVTLEDKQVEVYLTDASNSTTYLHCNGSIVRQGAGSLNDLKPNISLDLLNVDGESISLKIGDMIAADGFHLKGFYRDPSQTRDQGGSRVWSNLVKTLPYPYNKVSNIIYEPSVDRPKNVDFTYDAKYFPYGFPCEVYFNDTFYGLYTFRLKKTRENYALNKDDLNHLFLDSSTYTAFLKEPFDPADWELRNPKIKGYDAMGPIPPKFASVQASCERLFNFTSNLQSRYADHATVINLPHWITFYIVAELIGDEDHDGNNYNLLSWDNTHWSIVPYDMDWTLGWWKDRAVTVDKFYLSGKDNWSVFRSVYSAQIKSQYALWRSSGAISVQSLAQVYIDIAKYIPREIFSKDKKAWGIYATDSIIWGDYPTAEQIYIWFNARIEFLDKQWLTK